MTSLEFDKINSELYKMSSSYYGENELNKSLCYHDYELSDDFLGFVHFYKKISEIIKVEHSFIVDFGCGMGLQHLFFKDAIGYIGIDSSDYFRPKANDPDRNYAFLRISGRDFISDMKPYSKITYLTNLLYNVTGNRKIVRDFDPDKVQVIALCNMVPDMDLRKTINNEFINVFNYYG